MPDGIERVPEQMLEFEVVETRLSCTAAPGPCVRRKIFLTIVWNFSLNLERA